MVPVCGRCVCFAAGGFARRARAPPRNWAGFMTAWRAMGPALLPMVPHLQHPAAWIGGGTCLRRVSAAICFSHQSGAFDQRCFPHRCRVIQFFSQNFGAIDSFLGKNRTTCSWFSLAAESKRAGSYHFQHGPRRSGGVMYGLFGSMPNGGVAGRLAILLFRRSCLNLRCVFTPLCRETFGIQNRVTGPPFGVSLNPLRRRNLIFGVFNDWGTG